MPAVVLVTIYLAAEACTSIGFGPANPVGDIRPLIAAEVLNGLLLIGLRQRRRIRIASR